MGLDGMGWDWIGWDGDGMSSERMDRGEIGRTAENLMRSDGTGPGEIGQPMGRDGRDEIG